MKIPSYHKSLDVLHFGTLKPRAYFIPYENLQDALSGDRTKSAYFTSLCGEWSYKFYESFEDIDCEFWSESFDYSSLPEVPVPGNVQLYKNVEHDKPLYSNLYYPFPVDPPHVPDENPCSVFIKEFFINDEMADRDNILTFEGVASCFYLWINGQFVGYSQISHATSEFDITKFVHKGVNKIAVLVVKWCDGSYLEDQDFFRLSGIFREVYILSRSKIRLEDVYVKQSFNDDFTSATLDVDCILNAKADISYGLISPAGYVINNGDSTKSHFEIKIDEPMMWNDEKPHIYTLFLTVEDEIIPLPVALCKKEIKDKKLLINGKAAKLRGINRHDSTENGYVVTVDDMKKDLLMMKRANVNCIRTSHYPNDPRFVELAQALGFYLVNEADIETHGMGWNTDEDWDWFRWSMLSTIDEWEAAYVDRAEHLFERDKNQGCVVMWSLGNESGCGKNHRAMRNYIKSRDNTAIVHYENAHLEFKAVPEGENFADISDVESRMYSGYNYTDGYLNNPDYNKPFYWCEYVCSMTTGDVHEYWKLVDKYENHTGGCIWEWSDHAVRIDDENGNARYYYGGDFGEYPHNGICCIDGLVFPDRTPRPGYYDMKKVYEPFRTEYKNGTLTIKNVRYFTPLSDLYADWKVESNGITIVSGRIESLDIAPQDKKEFRLTGIDEFNYTGDTFLTVSVKQKNDTLWADAGYEVGFGQFEIESAKAETERETKLLVCEDGDRFVKITNGENEYTFDKAYGRIASIKTNGAEILEKPSSFKLWRAPSYNVGSSPAWYANNLHHVTHKTYSADVEKAENAIVIKTKIALGGPANPPVIKADVDYIFNNDGTFSVEIDGKIKKEAPVLPRIGIELHLKEDFENINYFGLGEIETYVDRNKAAKFGNYSLTVTENYVPYIRPQENSSHFRTRRVTLSNESGNSVTATGYGIPDFSFNASHFSAEQLTEKKHHFELEKEPYTILNLDGRFTAHSENPEFNNDENNRIIDEKEFKFGFMFEVK